MSDEKPRGECQVCGRSITLTQSKKIRAHGDKKSWPPANCRGSGNVPKEAVR